MPGKVIKLDVAEGEEVRKNQTLVIVEAMKMENEIKSAIDGSRQENPCGGRRPRRFGKALIELEAERETPRAEKEARAMTPNTPESVEGMPGNGAGFRPRGNRAPRPGMGREGPFSPWRSSAGSGSWV